MVTRLWTKQMEQQWETADQELPKCRLPPERSRHITIAHPPFSLITKSLSPQE